MNDYQVYCMTHPTNDPAELTRRLWEQTRAFTAELDREREREKMKREIIAEVLKQLRVEVKNEASPAIREIKKDIENLFAK